MYILGEEAMVSNPQGSVAGGHVARRTGGHLSDSGHRHPSNHCGHTNLHGPQGTKQSVNRVSRQITPKGTFSPCVSKDNCCHTVHLPSGGKKYPVNFACNQQMKNHLCRLGNLEDNGI